jgi:HTH-type transcriptional regulator / antitoxin MqsA
MASDKITCPFCGSSSLKTTNDRVIQITLGRRKSEVKGLPQTTCDNCAATFQTATQHRVATQAVQAEQKKLSFVTPREIRELRLRFGISQDLARRIFGGGRTAFSKYERGLVIPSEPSAKLMQVARDVPGVLSYLAKLENVDIPESVLLSGTSRRGYGRPLQALRDLHISVGTISEPNTLVLAVQESFDPYRGHATKRVKFQGQESNVVAGSPSLTREQLGAAIVDVKTVSFGAAKKQVAKMAIDSLRLHRNL